MFKTFIFGASCVFRKAWNPCSVSTDAGDLPGTSSITEDLSCRKHPTLILEGLYLAELCQACYSSYSSLVITCTLNSSSCSELTKLSVFDMFFFFQPLFTCLMPNTYYKCCYFLLTSHRSAADCVLLTAQLSLCCAWKLHQRNSCDFNRQTLSYTEAERLSSECMLRTCWNPYMCEQFAAKDSVCACS